MWHTVEQRDGCWESGRGLRLWAGSSGLLLVLFLDASFTSL